MTRVVDSPLSSVDVCSASPRGTADTEVRSPAERPLVLRGLRPAPTREVPDHLYDPQRQIATDPAGNPLAPNMEKEWTTIEGTHTDGDGGDNELWQWEEQ